METANQVQQARTVELVRTVNSLGWKIVMELAEDAVKEAETAVWNCKDRAQRDDLVLKAQAAREFLSGFRQRIESAKGLTPSEKHTFNEVSIE